MASFISNICGFPLSPHKLLYFSFFKWYLALIRTQQSTYCTWRKVNISKYNWSCYEGKSSLLKYNLSMTLLFGEPYVKLELMRHKMSFKVNKSNVKEGNSVSFSFIISINYLTLFFQQLFTLLYSYIFYVRLKIQKPHCISSHCV